MTVAVLVLVVVGIGLAVLCWCVPAHARAQLTVSAAMVLALAVAGLLVLVGSGPPGTGVGAPRSLLVLLAGLAVAGGGPLAVSALALADHKHSPAIDALEEGEVLRGGAWIGALERAGIYATLVAGWPEGVAIVLAVKGVGRYNELGAPGAAERFIIGTFASVLWAAACAGLWWYG